MTDGGGKMSRIRHPPFITLVAARGFRLLDPPIG